MDSSDSDRGWSNYTIIEQQLRIKNHIEEHRPSDPSSSLEEPEHLSDAGRATTNAMASQQELKNPQPYWGLLAGGALATAISFALRQKRRGPVGEDKKYRDRALFSVNEAQSVAVSSPPLQPGSSSRSNEPLYGSSCIDDNHTTRHLRSNPNKRGNEEACPLSNRPCYPSKSLKLSIQDAVNALSHTDCQDWKGMKYNQTVFKQESRVDNASLRTSSKHKIVQKLRQQLKNRDEMILEMQACIMEQQRIIEMHHVQTLDLEQLLKRANKTVIEVGQENQWLQNALAEHHLHCMVGCDDKIVLVSGENNLKNAEKYRVRKVKEKTRQTSHQECVEKATKDDFADEHRPKRHIAAGFDDLANQGNGIVKCIESQIADAEKVAAETSSLIETCQRDRQELSSALLELQHKVDTQALQLKHRKKFRCTVPKNNRGDSLQASNLRRGENSKDPALSKISEPSIAFSSLTMLSGSKVATEHPHDAVVRPNLVGMSIGDLLMVLHQEVNLLLSGGFLSRPAELVENLSNKLEHVTKQLETNVCLTLEQQARLTELNRCVTILHNNYTQMNSTNQSDKEDSAVSTLSEEKPCERTSELSYRSKGENTTHFRSISQTRYARMEGSNNESMQDNNIAKRVSNTCGTAFSNGFKHNHLLPTQDPTWKLKHPYMDIAAIANDPSYRPDTKNIEVSVNARCDACFEEDHSSSTNKSKSDSNASIWSLKEEVARLTLEMEQVRVEGADVVVTENNSNKNLRNSGAASMAVSSPLTNIITSGSSVVGTKGSFGRFLFDMGGKLNMDHGPESHKLLNTDQSHEPLSPFSKMIAKLELSDALPYGQRHASHVLEFNKLNTTIDNSMIRLDELGSGSGSNDSAFNRMLDNTLDDLVRICSAGSSPCRTSCSNSISDIDEDI